MLSVTLISLQNRDVDGSALGASSPLGVGTSGELVLLASAGCCACVCWG